MCRLFGFRSNVPAPVHRSLVAEQNSLRKQSKEHKDGWGIAYYGDEAAPRVAHGLGPAHEDEEFERVSGRVSSHAVIAHVRLASVGKVELCNAHPFLHGRWAFCHNGTVRDFAQRHREAFEAEIAPHLRGHLKGETDSERCFFIFLTRLETYGGLDHPDVDAVARALAETMRLVKARTDTPEKPSSTNFLVSNGALMVATRRNRTLHFSGVSAQRDVSEVHRDGALLQQFVVASEELSSERHWHPVPEEALIGVTPDLTLRTWTLDGLAPPGQLTG